MVESCILKVVWLWAGHVQECAISTGRVSLVAACSSLGRPSLSCPRAR
jgi:hypothetical protein